MKKGLLLLGCITMLACASSKSTFAQQHIVTKGYATKDAQVMPLHQNTPIESFIARVGQTNKFAEVSNIWQPDNAYDKTGLLQSVKRVQPLTIDYTAVADLIQKNKLAISLVVPGINGGTYTIDLAQYSPISNGFQLFADAGNGNVTKVDYTPGKYYSGVVHGIPGSVAGFSFFNNEVYGIFSIPGVGNLVLVPNSTYGPGYNSNPNYVLYNDVDLTITNRAPKCGVDQLDLSYLDHFKNTANKTTTTPNNNVYESCKEVNLLEVGDYSYYLQKGSSLTNCANHLSAMMNNQATIYRNEGIILNLKAIKINTATDIYQTLSNSSSVYLNAFGDDIQNTYASTYGCNLAMLVTCTHGGGMGGVAWVGVMCATYGATQHTDATAISNIDVNGSLTSPAFPTYSWNVEVLSHEMGHNVGSMHTQACVWNPVYTGVTAIDGCVATEGPPTCSDPGLPAAGVGGTIMSYCHLAPSVGINFSNGFGPQPGTVIRQYIERTSPTGEDKAPAGCVPSYLPDSALNTANTNISANRECTELTTSVTYYWYDNNTADHHDDVLVLMIKKNGNNIGDLNTSGFSVSTSTIVRYGIGRGDTLTFPSGTSPSILAQSYGFRRYWKMTTPTNPTSNVEVMYPYLYVDTVDVHGSVALPLAPLTSYLMYQTSGGIDPNPLNSFPASSPSNFNIRTYSSTLTPTTWTSSVVTHATLAHFLTTNLNGGGSGFYSYCTPHTAPAISSMPAAPCPNSPVSYTVDLDATALSYIWTVTGTGWSGSSTTGTINLTAGTGIGTMTVRAVDGCGNGNTYTFNVTPAPLPTMAITPTSGLCSTDVTAALASSATSGGPVTGYAWSVSGTGWSISGPSNGSNVNLNVGAGTGTLTVQGTNVCGTGAVTTYNVVMSNLPPVTPSSITPPALICPSSSGNFTTPPIANATSYNWTVTGTGWSGTSSSNTINTTIGTGPGTLTVSATNSCGTGPVYSHAFTTSSGPGAATAINSSSIPCSGNSTTLSTPAVPTASGYTWSILGTGWSGSSSTNSITAIAGTGTATITVTPFNACGSGSSFSTVIAPAPAPTSTFAVSTHITAVNSNVYTFYTGTAPAGSVFTWSFPGGTGTPGTGSGVQTVSYSTPGQYIIFLNVNNGAGCTSSTADTIHVLSSGAGVQNINDQKISASIVPNPNNGAFDIIFTDDVSAPLTVKLYDMQGRVVYHNDFASITNKKISVETDNLPAGVYTATIFTNGSAMSSKVTILR